MILAGITRRRKAMTSPTPVRLVNEFGDALLVLDRQKADRILTARKKETPESGRKNE
jgi:hypothetical protein